MPFDEGDNPYRAPVAEPGPQPVVRVSAPTPDTPAYRWARLYCRLFGSLQVGYALFFGWVAFLQLGHLFPNTRAFGTTQDIFNLCAGALSTLLSGCCFVAGYSLVRLRHWVRRWEIIYLAVCATVLFISNSYIFMYYKYGPDEFVPLALFSMPLVLPYLPFLSKKSVRYFPEHQARELPTT